MLERFFDVLQGSQEQLETGLRQIASEIRDVDEIFQLIEAFDKHGAGKKPEFDDKPQEPKFYLKILEGQCSSCGAAVGLEYNQSGANASCSRCNSGLESQVMFIYDPYKRSIVPGVGLLDPNKKIPKNFEPPEGYATVAFIEHGDLQVPVLMNENTGLIEPGRSLDRLLAHAGVPELEVSDGSVASGLLVVHRLKVGKIRYQFDSEENFYGLGNVMIGKVEMNGNTPPNVKLVLKPGIIGDIGMNDDAPTSCAIVIKDDGDAVVIDGLPESRNTVIVTGNIPKNSQRQTRIFGEGKNPVLVAAPGANIVAESLRLTTLVVCPGASVNIGDSTVENLIIVQPGRGGAAATAVVDAVNTTEVGPAWYNEHILREMKAILGIKQGGGDVDI